MVDITKFPEIASEDFSVDTSVDYGINYSSITVPTLNNVTVPSYTFSSSVNVPPVYTYNPTWITAGSGTASHSASMTVKGDAEFEGDIKVKGRSLTEFMATLENRLAILQPNPKKLEKFEALKKAYNHYKTLEALCQEEDEDGK
jgi:hypothetical protein